MTAERDQMMQMLDASADAVATFTGIKAQFVDSGWDELSAEQMVIEMLKNMRGNRP
jgi:hypothetical protein